MIPSHPLRHQNHTRSRGCSGRTPAGAIIPIDTCPSSTSSPIMPCPSPERQGKAATEPSRSPTPRPATKEHEPEPRGSIKDGRFQKGRPEDSGLKDYVGVREKIFRAMSLTRPDSSSATQQLGDCLGKGAFGSVYRALNWGTGETVAVKKVKLADLPKSELRVIMVGVGPDPARWLLYETADDAIHSSRLTCSRT